METAERIRKDNRPSNKLRPITVKLGVINSADGSAEFALGKSKVLVVVHGPVATKSRYEQIDRTTLKVTVESYDSAPSKFKGINLVLIIYHLILYRLEGCRHGSKLEKMLHSVIFWSFYTRDL